MFINIRHCEDSGITGRRSNLVELVALAEKSVFSLFMQHSLKIYVSNALLDNCLFRDIDEYIQFQEYYDSFVSCIIMC